MRGEEAQSKCPDVKVFMVEEQRGKANLNKFRAASNEVMNAISSFDPKIVVERASIDEAYLDLTNYIESCSVEPVIDDLSDMLVAGILEENQINDVNEAHKKSLQYFFEQVESNSDDHDLLVGAYAVKQIRNKILDQTQFKCSAGISRNKMLAKLSSVLNKPNGQTLLPLSSVPFLYRTTPITKVANLGGKLGEEIKKIFKIELMSELAELSQSQLAQHFNSKTCQWLINVSKGLEHRPVVARSIPKSIGCGKNFTGIGRNALTTLEQATFWILQLSEELVERLATDEEANGRRAKLLTVSIKFHDKDVFSKSLPLYDITAEKISEDVKRHVFSKYTLSNGSLVHPIVMLSLMAAKFTKSYLLHNVSKLDTYFAKAEKPQDQRDNETSITTPTESVTKTSETDTCVQAATDTSSAGPQIITLVEESSGEKSTDIAKCQKTAKRGFFYRKTIELLKDRDKVNS